MPFSLLPQALASVEKWESCSWISTFARPTLLNSLLALRSETTNTRRSCGNVGISPVLGEISKGLVERGVSLPLAFHAFHSPAISTALFLVLFSIRPPAAVSFALRPAFRLLILLGLLRPVTRDV